MIKFPHKIQNIGIDANTELEIAKRIRIVNTIAIIAIFCGFMILAYAYLDNWPVQSFFVFGFISASTFVPLILNHFKKTYASRMIFVFIAYIDIIALCIVFGSSFHYQYFFLGVIGLPLVFLGNEPGKKKLYLCGLAVILWMYTEWHFTVFEPWILIDSLNTNSISLVNDLMTFLMVFITVYVFTQESDQHLKTLEDNSKLEETNIQLEHFAYIASHDLNEPLRTVSSFVDIIKEEYEETLNEDLDTYFSFINDALTRMRLMIDGLLNYSRIGKSGDFQVVDMNILLSEVKKDLEVLIKQKNVIIKGYKLPEIYCLELEIRQLFQNLITNAIKFQHLDVAPVIEVTSKEKRHYWQFCVSDNGIGISSEMQHKIFNIFTKLHLQTDYEGHGIGLAFCKKIVEIHQGKIWVESEPHQGSRFYFTILKKK